MERENILEKFSEFFNEYYKEELMKVVSENKKSIAIDFSLLVKFDVDLADYLLENPEETFATAEDALRQFDVGFETKLKVRFYNLPEDREIRIRKVRAEHLGKMIVIDGIIKRASEVRPEVSEAIFQCLECGSNITIIQTERAIKIPIECENPSCGNRKAFKLVGQKLYDARWVVVEEPYESTEGERPSDLRVYLKEDLTIPKIQNKTEPGNRIKAVGVLKELPRRVKGTLSRQMEIYLEANYVESVEAEWDELEITPENEQKIMELARDPEVYTKLRDSIAPGLYGLEEIKQAIVLQLFSGETHIQPDRSRVRGDIHILLVGDPATSKSALMKVVSGLIPRGKYVSGKGVTGAGLCATYNTLVQLEDGSLIEIGELVEEELKKDTKKIKEGFITNDTRKILSFDSKNLKIKPMKITKYWKLRAPKKLVKITTQTGKRVIVTPDNPIPIIKNADIVWKRASKVSPREYIATPRTMQVYTTKKSQIELLDRNAWLLNKQLVVEELVKNIKINSDIRSFSKELGINENDLYHGWKHRGAPTLGEIGVICTKLGLKVENILPHELVLTQYRGHKIKVPLFLTPDLAYLMGLIAGDGSISQTEHGGFDIKFFNIHSELLNAFKNICKNEVGIIPSYNEDGNKVPYYRFNSKILGNLLNKYGIVDGDKSHNLKIKEELSLLPHNIISSYIQGIFDTDGYVIERKTKGSNYVGITSASEDFLKAMQLILLRYGIISLLRERKPKTSIIRGRQVRSGKTFELKISGLENLKIFKERIGFRLKEKAEKLEGIINKTIVDGTNIDVIPEIGRLLRDARKRLGLSAKEFYGYKNYAYETKKRKPTRKMLEKILNEFGDIEELKKFAHSDIFWDKIKKVEVIDNREHEYVYDVTVEDEHSFVANGLIIHNTATVVKDEEFLGGWVLEAGALVMTNRSICCIDEFEKIERTDQVALHEMMEQQTISIAKANIIATLPAMTSILAGGNPKLGRFDPYVPIKEQIDLPETILTRFDLKFALRDIPNPEIDTKIAEHILASRHFGGQEATPVIDNDSFKKYVAYARKNCHPKLSRDAADEIRNFYLNLRERSGEESPIAITPRQYEALIRMAEASAKIQLRNEVTKEDALRAITLMKASLRQFGFEPETGMIDIDRAEGARATASQRSKIRIMLDILDELTNAYGKEIPVGDIIKMAKEQNVENPDDILRKMQQEGIVFSPKLDFYSKVR